MNTQMQDLAAWLLTYAMHSTLFLGTAWLVVRSGRLDHAATEIVWKVALVGGLITASAQSVLELQPAGTISLAARATAPVAAQSADEFDKDAVQPIELADPAASAATSGTSAPTPGAEGTPTSPAKAPLAWTAIVASLWLAVALLLVLAYTARRLILTGRLGDRRPVIDPALKTLLDNLRRETGVEARILLTSSQAISSPVALGVGEICLPAEALSELDAEQQRAMLAHELAHLVRRDPQWLAFASLLERALFFQPLNRLARTGIQTSAEYLADEWAARRTGGVPLARALVKVAEWIQASPLGVPVAGFAEERSQLTVRVSRLLDRATWGTPRSRWGTAMLAALTLVLMTAFAPGVSRLALQTPAASDRPLSFNSPRDTSVVDAVIDRLKDDDAEVRRAAAHALGRMGNITAIAPLIAALEDEDEEVRHAALDALSNFERGVPAAPIRRLLDNANSEVRQQALSMLGNMKDRSSIPTRRCGTRRCTHLMNSTRRSLTTSWGACLRIVQQRSARPACRSLVSANSSRWCRS